MKLVWITGGGSGIGEALARRMAAEGMRVIVSGRNAAKLDAVAASGQGRIIPVPLDITDGAAVMKVVEHIEASLGPIDLAVLNAGDYEAMGLETFSAALARRLMDVNYHGTIACLDALLPRMRARQRGHVALVASLAGYRGLPLAAAYGPTKAALINLAESLKLDCDSAGIHLQVVNPGFVATPLTARNSFQMPDIISPDSAAEQLLAGLKGQAFEIRFPRRFAGLMGLLRHLPYSWFFPLVRRITRA